MMKDVRWQQRFSNFLRALERLKEGIDLADIRELSDLEKQGVIQAFEFTHELAWNTIKDFYADQGVTGLQGSRDAVRLAFKRGLLDDGDAWMEMIGARNKTSHLYDQELMESVFTDVRFSYFPQFEELRARLLTRQEDGGG